MNMETAPLERISMPFTYLPHGKGLEPPEYQSALAAGLDLMAALPEDEPLVIAPGERCLVPTGLALEIPAGLEGQIRPRSGLAWKHGVTVLNAPGTIDADYRGEVKIILINLGQDPFTVTRGMRIAQLLINKVIKANLKLVDRLNRTERAGEGFGSTGIEHSNS